MIPPGFQEANPHAKISVKYPEYPHFACSLLLASRKGASSLLMAQIHGTFDSSHSFNLFAIAFSVT